MGSLIFVPGPLPRGQDLTDLEQCIASCDLTRPIPIHPLALPLPLIRPKETLSASLACIAPLALQAAQPTTQTHIITMTEPLSKVDSAVEGLSGSPPKDKAKRRASSHVPGVYNILDLEEEKTEIELAPETQKTGWKINTSSGTVEDKDILKLHLTKPPVKRIDLHFPLGMEVTARNLKGVTIKDAMDAIHKAYKKKSDDELDNPYLKGFEWDKEESWTRLVVHLQKDAGLPAGGGKKKKSKKEEE
ncbi:hypothetical protein HYQ44_018634 [Verticillium longisporum]|nr:hypothetical protein HYQ44_018634 [Verticillium longisporum]